MGGDAAGARGGLPRLDVPLIEAGEGEAEGFDLAEADLIEHAEHGDEHGTDPIWRDAAGFDEEEIPGLDDERYGAGDDEDPET